MDDIHDFSSVNFDDKMLTTLDGMKSSAALFDCDAVVVLMYFVLRWVPRRRGGCKMPGTELSC